MFLFTNAGVLSYLCSFSHFAWVGSKRGNLGAVFLRISYICALFIPFPLLLPHLIFDHVSCSSFLSRIPLLCLPTSFLAPLSWCWHSVRKGLGSRRYLVVLKLCSILSTRKQLYCSLSRKQKVQGVLPGLVGWLSDADRCSSCCLSALLLSVRSAVSLGPARLPGGSGGEEEAAQETSAFFSLVGVCLLPHSWLLGGRGRESLPFSDSAAEAGQEKRAGKKRWVS